jgi:hypothetical protein
MVPADVLEWAQAAEVVEKLRACAYIVSGKRFETVVLFERGRQLAGGGSNSE